MTSERMRVLVVDDERMARTRLVRLLSALPDVEVVGECADGTELVARAGEADVVLLDVHMPHLTGVEALGLLGDDGPVVVFTTAHPDFALAAFDGGAVDYLLKPVEPARLRRALDRARARLNAPVVDPLSPPQALPSRRIPLPTAKGIHLLDPDEIRAAQLDGETVVVDTTRGRLFTSLSLAELEPRLPAERFLRVHRRALVNLARVDRLEDVDSGGYLAVLDDGQRVAVSRQTARRLRALWGER